MHFKCYSVRLRVYALKTDRGESGDWDRSEVKRERRDLSNDKMNQRALQIFFFFFQKQRNSDLPERF